MTAAADKNDRPLPPWVRIAGIAGYLKTTDINAEMRSPKVRRELEKMRRLMADIRAAEKNRTTAR